MPEKSQVKSMFAGIAKRYDLANLVLSFGVYRLWYNKLIKYSRIKPEMKVLDCATGTGSLAMEIRAAKGYTVEVTGIDFTPEMLEIAREKAKEYHLKINFEEGDVMNLRFQDATFDIATIAFGIRNVESPEKGISEMARVIKPGGKVVILEFGQPYAFFKPFYSFYSKFIMPILGKIITGKQDAYEYLVNTSAKFPCRSDFIRIMESTGRFSQCKYIPLTFGIAYLYLGTVGNVEKK